MDDPAISQLLMYGTLPDGVAKPKEGLYTLWVRCTPNSTLTMFEEKYKIKPDRKVKDCLGFIEVSRDTMLGLVMDTNYSFTLVREVSLQNQIL